ncbi:MAG: ribose 5-phosphate isomerase B [bacterium]
MKIAIGADHGGYQLKEAIKTHLDRETPHQVVDFGTYDEESCDYPDYARMVAEGVAADNFERGIMVDTTGIASTIVGNKVKGVRATCPTNEFTANSSRVHNNSNMLVLGAEQMGAGRAQKIVDLWLETEFGGGRHQRRVDKINQLDRER